MKTEKDEAALRANICRQLGIPSILKAHELIVEGTTRGAGWLKHLGFHSKNLADLGYSEAALKKLGYKPDALRQLGFFIDEPVAEKTAPAPTCSARDPGLKRLLEGGAHATEIKRAGFTIIQCKHAGLGALELAHLGFEIADICSACSAAEMRRADFKASELRNHFSDYELKNAGFSASEMRLSGFSVRDLLNLGYNENHIRTAGFSTMEMLKEGLTKLVKSPIQGG